MTLGQFAVAVGASPRWVLNALTRLRVPRRYNEPLARRLAVAKALHDSAGMVLPRAWAEAARILAEADYFQDWTTETDDASVTIVVHLPRIFTNYQVRLAAARGYYTPKRRGRKPVPRGSAVERASAYGWDTSLLDAQLVLPPEERLRRLDADTRFVDSMRKVAEP